MNRRDFVKSVAAVTVGALAGQGISLAAGGENVSTRDVGNGPFDETLAGVSDIHVHAAPDTRARSIDELSFARDAQAAGYRCVMFKSNDWSCHDRAYLIRSALPGFPVFGSLIMNRAHGDRVNAYAAEMAVKTTGNLCRCIWMPTTHAAYPLARQGSADKGIPVLDGAGRVLPEVVRVMEICAEADIIFATGHSSPEECLVLARRAREVGVGKFVVTHANSLIWRLTPDQVKACVDLGAFIEYSFITNLWGPGSGMPTFERMGDDEFLAYVRLAPERSFVTTDLGQVGMPHPLDGMRACIELMRRGGIPQQDMDLLVRKNPAMLAGLDRPARTPPNLVEE